jgi:hypothetical protein
LLPLGCAAALIFEESAECDEQFPQLMRIPTLFAISSAAR